MRLMPAKQAQARLMSAPGDAGLRALALLTFKKDRSVALARDAEGAWELFEDGFERARTARESAWSRTPSSASSPGATSSTSTSAARGAPASPPDRRSSATPPTRKGTRPTPDAPLASPAGSAGMRASSRYLFSSSTRS